MRRAPVEVPLAVVPVGAAERGRPALRRGAARMDYGALSDAVEALRAALARTPEGTVVGIRIGNQPAFVVAFLACLAARRPAVLLDVLWTQSELAQAASCLELSLLLETADTPGREAAAAAFGAPIRALGADGEMVGGELVGGELDARAVEDGPAGAAVVYWSSGSTGRPKPIAVSRAALAHRLACYDRVSRLDASDRTLCILPLSHCHGIECVALPILRARGELVLLDPLAAEPGRVIGIVRDCGITAFSALPRFYEALLQYEPPPEALATLRYAMSGSAAIDPRVADGFARRFGVRIGLGYGLTEVGVVCLNQHEHGPVRYDSVGPVLDGVEWRIEGPDADGVGELWVRSAGCALELGGAGGARPERDRDADGWLGTRDLVRADPDGHLHVVGRLSTFVNVNGAKADPREIEGVIEELPWVAECAVVGAPAAGGGERIIAYVAPRPGDRVPYPEEAVQQRVAESLSVYKVPSRVVLLDALPRTTLGKLAYARLPRPETVAPAGPAGGEPPRDETERRVAALWCEVLGVEGVGVTDGFSRLGGTSLQLAELVARLQQQFGCSFTIVDLFRYPTVETQARALSGEASSGHSSSLQERARKQREALRASAGRAEAARGAVAGSSPRQEDPA